MTTADYGKLSDVRPKKSLTMRLEIAFAAGTRRAASRCAIRAAATKNCTAWLISSRISWARKLSWKRWNTIRIARRSSRSCEIADGKKSYILAPENLAVGMELVIGGIGAAYGRQSLAVAEHSGRAIRFTM